ncbi:hybrid sensor histidine kinase/response regulator [Schauerella aestuarii]|uniref:hybrid sensor histidine kinase/response regulator n=1 Tax=Schauerella aestuarii TaxID=2511204 RepID=UPI00136A3591|nr:PAS domain-containing sensor histidine kinase [Achromobacter aestuarii]MYZ44465.1 PAS domain-containing sensor histidine kinase [Achromobacter aestuarii]
MALNPHAASHAAQAADGLDFLGGSSACAALLRERDWSGTALGMPEQWPVTLKTTLRVVLASRFPMMIHWGRDLITFYNDAYAPSLRDKHPGALGSPARAWWSELWDELGPMFDRVLAGETYYAENKRYAPMRDGARRDAYFTHCHSPIWDERGEVVGIFLVVNETTLQVTELIEREAFEATLRQTNDMLEQRALQSSEERDRVWAHSRDLLVVSSFDGVWRDVSPSCDTILGRRPAEMIGRNSVDLVHPDDVPLTLGALAASADQVDLTSFENRLQHADGSYRWISWHTRVGRDRVYSFGRDITHEKAQESALAMTEAQLRQAQKMEAVGQLTGGLAHDFNNLLTGVTGSLELMRRRLAADTLDPVSLERYIRVAQDAASRAASLTHRLLAFSRRQTLDPTAIDAAQLVTGLRDLIDRTVGPAVALTVTAAPGLWPILVDASQLENALLNLCINARDAMPDGGRLAIETQNVVLATAEAHALDLTPGDYVVLTVNDTGCGMPPAVVARAFDPFYTTKPLGSGTGLGLSMTYGFARQSNGTVRIESTPNVGTTLWVYLPRHAQAAELTAQTLDCPVALPDGPARETVLVIDDEPTVRLLVLEVLESLGYRTLEAADGPTGMRILQSSAPIDLLITDVGLPGGMNGRQVADAARVVRPGLKVLFITGYAESVVMNNTAFDASMQVLTKPFGLEPLVQRIKSMLSVSGGTPAA